MRVGLVPAALLFVALGLALASAPRSARPWSLLALVTTSGVFTFVPTPQAWLDGAFLGCWIAVVATAATVLLVRGLGLFAALLLSIDAGVWASAVISPSGSRLDVLVALPCLLVVLPASWVARRYDSIPVKVVSSWIIAVAVLAITVQLLPVTPGYLPDHME
jgi:hypothetical protein